MKITELRNELSWSEKYHTTLEFVAEMRNNLAAQCSDLASRTSLRDSIFADNRKLSVLIDRTILEIFHCDKSINSFNLSNDLSEIFLNGS